MAAWTVAACQAANLARLSSPKVASTPHSASLIHRRGLAGGGDHHGPPKVNFWQDPMSPSKWKEEHFVIVSLTGWGLLFYGGYKFFTRGKKDQKEQKIGEEALGLKQYLNMSTSKSWRGCFSYVRPSSFGQF